MAAFGVAACSRSTPASRETSGSTQGTTASAAGTVASSGVPKDSISERADRGRIFGDSTATVWLIMASDFQCPFCKQWHHTSFAPFMRDYAAKGKIRMAFLNFPISNHQNAVPAAEAAMCASAQNKFVPMADALFATQERWSQAAIPGALFDSLARAVGLNVNTYRDCMVKHSTLALVQADRDRAAQAGVRSTPTFFVGSQMFSGADERTSAAMRAAIDAALAKANTAKKPAN
jgi:protein-disulfide isomerase